ncbi:lipopolysaccharide export system ATP-binding protein [Hydrogenispora ethanolica]|uniref:Lipopolysaccharide export system ATP-binding protein n=1 Tax=Hydrogenispora ethanolica TaxID=1082276 RepID=A0A4R1RD02_HYDET|nr:LPS export ABC transporter ATP-binding protein [Hydrogenispora ethanolica]TCL63741.1 lipopolysaccharide export system ATP-binding protein [Hydrogenispora ethanolica]
MPIIVEGLVKQYQRRQVVSGVSLEVNAGEVVGLLGPNGAGKTTTFYMIVGLERCNAGSIRIDDHDVTTLPMHSRARYGVSYLAQEASIFRKLTVQDNIMAILELTNLTKSERQERCEQLMSEFGLTGLRKSFGYMLSGGERRRAEIARALAMNPDYILLDEPFTGVDPIAVADIQDIINRLRNRGMGILITDHSVRETLAITDRAYIMYAGQILTSGSSEQIANDENARKFYLGDRFNM